MRAIFYRMRVRIRLAELLKEKQTNPRKLELATNGAISARTLYRIKAAGGRVRYVDTVLCDRLCDVLGVTPGELFER